MPGKRIVICADGTWNSPYRSDGTDPSRTNVFRISQAVKPMAHDEMPQLVYYHPGVGTGWTRLDRVLGGGMGVGLSKSIVDAYVFLVDNYEAGDRIFLFGFSRGASTVRSLAGLIRNCGILRKEHADRVAEAYRRYRNRDAPEWHPNGLEAMAFRDRYSWRETRRRSEDPRGQDTVLHFLGVWDTVGALGVPAGLLRWLTKRSYVFHDTQLSRWVDHAYHAVAIDERRAPFFPTLWDPGSPRLAGQTLQQVWFAGVHANVGGGYPDRGLSDLALGWLAHHAMAHGLDLDRTIGGSANALGSLADSQTLGFRALGIWGKLNPVTRWYARTDLRAAEDVEIARRTSWTGDCLRPIPPGTTIHPSVDRRRLGRPEYRPANVAMAPTRRASGAAGISAA